MVEVVDLPDKINDMDGFAQLLAQYPWTEFRVLRTNLPRDYYWDVYAIMKKNNVAFDYLAMGDEEVDWEHVVLANRVVAVDIDNTLIKWDEGRWRPNEPIIRYVNRLYDDGALIVIWTARSYVQWYETRKLLKDIGVKYDFLVMSKLFAHEYIDDIPVKHPDSLV